jgi:hypothetical protein
MSTTISTHIHGVPALRGIPGLAVRTGRLLELWGRRAARPASRSDLALRREADWHAHIAVAAHEARELRTTYQALR